MIRDRRSFVNTESFILINISTLIDGCQICDDVTKKRHAVCTKQRLEIQTFLSIHD